MICGRISCINFRKRDCGYTCEPGKHCDGYGWNAEYPIDPSEDRKKEHQFNVKKDRDADTI